MLLIKVVSTHFFPKSFLQVYWEPALGLPFPVL